MELLRFGEYRSCLGPLFVAKTARGICNVGVGLDRGFFIDGLKRRYGPCLVESAGPFSPLFRLFDRYFTGIDVRFDLPLDLKGTDFERAVWEALRTIPHGEVRNYGWVARIVGRPGGARAVGNACGKNPVPIIVPCHRVILSSGRIGGYSGGIGMKRALLEIEGAKILQGRG
jgi:O-6-methylguanine DNA methyltransferase